MAILPHTVTDDDVRNFAEVTGDKNPIHLDEEYAKNTIFEGRIVHGAFCVGLISRVIAEKLPGKGSILLSQYAKYIKPVRIGDELRVIVEVIATQERTTQANTLIIISCRYRLRTSIRNQKDE
ncbi:MAG: MaoC family dehydratase, partial [Planctomycetota bacterium]